MVEIIAIGTLFILLITVIDFIRRGLLKEKYAALWFVLIFFLLVLSFWRGLLDEIAHLVGIAYPPSLLFFVAFVFTLLILLHYSVVISILSDRNKTLAQEMALLKAQLKEIDENGKDIRK